VRRCVWPKIATASSRCGWRCSVRRARCEVAAIGAAIKTKARRRLLLTAIVDWAEASAVLAGGGCEWLRSQMPNSEIQQQTSAIMTARAAR
jgi:hypothetical protein